LHMLTPSPPPFFWRIFFWRSWDIFHNIDGKLHEAILAERKGMQRGGAII
jgi:hypothetical protein